MEPPPARAAAVGAAPSVRQHADDVANLIKFDSLRMKVVKGIRLRTLPQQMVVLHLDELYGLALQPAVSAEEPESAAMIAKVKRWVVSGSARPAHMAHVDETTLLDFIAMELMSLDERLKEDLVVDARFAAFLKDNNAVKKSLAATKALMGGGHAVPPQPPRGAPPRPPRECPKCHGWHELKDCPSPIATLSRGGPINPVWDHNKGFGRGGGGGFPPGYPRGKQPVILPP